MNFRARGFEGGIWGGNRGFVRISLKLFWFEKRTSYQQRPGGKFLDEGFWRSYPSEEHPRAYVRAREEAGHRQEPFASALPPFSRRRFGIEILVLYLLA